MRVEYLVQSPHLRRYAELAVEFISRVLRSDVLNALGAVVVIDERTTESDTIDAVRKACQIVNVSEYGCPYLEVKKWYDLGAARLHSFGIYLYVRVEKPVIMWVLRNTKAPTVCGESYVLFHEVGHFMVRTLGAVEPVMMALAEDSMFGIVVEELRALVHLLPYHATEPLLAISEKEELKELVRFLGLMFVWAADEAVADYIATNYFVLLNTYPYPYPARLAKLSKLGIRCHTAYTALCDTAERIDGVVKVKKYRLNPRFAKAIGHMTSTFCKMEQVRMPRFVELAHNIFTSCVAVTPKELYLSEPERYSPILYGVIWDDVREMGFPALDTLVARLDIERAPLYEPYAKLIEVL
jgi:hypothetical protein